MFVLTQFNSASLNQHIKNTYNFDAFSHGFVDILAAEQTPGGSSWYQGTADAVRQCMRHLYNHDYEYILILSGDQLYQMDLEEFARFHIDQKADLTIATLPVTSRDAPGFGIMKVNEEGYIKTFIEKPALELLPDWKSDVSKEDAAAGRHYMASMGIYIFSKNIIKKLFSEDPGAMDFGKEIIPAAINGGLSVAGYKYGGYWEDIGSIRSFYETNIALTDDIPDFNLFDNKRIIYTRPRMLAPSKITGTSFTNTIVAEGCILLCKQITQSVIGIRSRIGTGTIIDKSVVFGNDYFETLEDMEFPDIIPMGIGQNCHIERTILDKNCRIGDDVIIRGDESLEDTETDTYRIVDGIIVIKKEAIIESGNRIGAADIK